MTDLRAKTGIVTGAARGIGYKIAETLLASGAKIAFIDNNSEMLATSASNLRTTYKDILTFQCDVTDSIKVDEVVSSVIENWGSIDILINNAGITRDSLFVRMSDEDWDSVININLKGTFLFTRAVTKHMMKRRYGRIVNISSVSGLFLGNPGQANYSASKAGLIGFTRTLAKEFASRSITINAIAPGFIETDMTKKLGEAMLEEARAQIPLGRLGKPEDIAALVKFLVSDEASYITGVVIPIDGGLTL